MYGVQMAKVGNQGDGGGNDHNAVGDGGNGNILIKSDGELIKELE